MSNLTTHEGDCAVKIRQIEAYHQRQLKTQEDLFGDKIDKLEAALTIAKEALCSYADDYHPGLTAVEVLAEIAKVMG